MTQLQTGREPLLADVFMLNRRLRKDKCLVSAGLVGIHTLPLQMHIYDEKHSS